MLYLKMSKVHLNHIIRCYREPIICVQVLISSLTIHNFHLYCFEKGFDLIFFITSTFPRHTFGKISHFRNVPKLLRLVPTVELPLKANQGHPTSIFEKYLFERRFAFQNFRNICCKISCLPASPRIFEHLKNGIIAHF